MDWLPVHMGDQVALPQPRLVGWAPPLHVLRMRRNEGVSCVVVARENPRSQLTQEASPTRVRFRLTQTM